MWGEGRDSTLGMPLGGRGVEGLCRDVTRDLIFF